MMSGHGTVETAVEATRLGAYDFVEKPLSLTKLLRTVERALDAGRRKRLSARAHGPTLAVPIGKSKVTQALREQVQHAASSASPVLHLLAQDRKSTRLNSSHANISYAVFCLKKKKMEDMRARYPHQLSGRQRQRVELASAL